MRDQYIQNIEGLFPIDSDFKDTNEVGKKMLLQAIEENDWRALPIEILQRYSELCIAEDNRQANSPSKF